jgi:UDP-3-O-[3-hydroxymyristoyl] glucosamine N-acyltransferase
LTDAGRLVSNPPVHKLGDLAKLVGGRVVGDPSLEIRRLVPFEDAGPGDLTLAADRKLLADLESTAASAVIVPPSVLSARKTLLQADSPKVAFARLVGLFYPRTFESQGISPLAFIGPDCRIPPQVTIQPFVYVGSGVTLGERVTLCSGVHVGEGSSIGDDCTLHPNAVLYHHVSLGRRVILHSGAVVGADGFGYVFDGKSHIPMPQVGTVIIGDDVEIGANSCVDRATFGATIIEPGVKLDNHVHIGHNCRIGRNTIMVAQVGVSGSVEIGAECIFAGHSGVVDHVKIGDHVRVMMKTGVSKDVPSNASVAGQPAMDHRKAMRIQAVMRRLPEMYDDWRKAGASSTPRTDVKDEEDG